MAIILEAVAANGAVQRVPLSDATTTIAAQPGLRYRLLNDAGGRVSQAALVKRLDGDLLVDGLPEGKILSLEGFFTRCTPQDACSLSMENIGGTPDETVTPATQAVSALPEGGFLMYASGMTASSVAPAPESEFSYKPFLGVAGGLVIVGGAGGGGGGGSTSSDTTPPDAPTITSGAFTNKTRPVFTGTAEAGATITMTLDVGNDGSTDVTYTTSADSGGSWVVDTATDAPTTGALGTIDEGVQILVIARAADSAGNLSAATVGVVQLDTIAPATPTITSALLTNDTTPEIRGAADSGSLVTVALDVDGNGTPDVAWVATAVSGSYFVDLGTTPASGTLPGGALPNQSRTNLSVTAADSAGNLSSSLPAVLDVDTSRPAAPTISLIALDDRVNAIEAGSAVTISGTLSEADRPVTVQWGSTAARTVTATGTTWSVTYLASDIPVDGAQTVRATYVNAYGSTSVEGTRSVLIDRAAPGAPTIALNPLSDSGTPGDLLTNDDTPIIRVTFGTGVAADDRVTVYSGATAVGTATLTAPDISAGYVDVTTATLGADGVKTLTATITDLVGNASAASSALGLTIDRTPPATPTVSALTTNDTTPVITGTATVGTGETLTVAVNGVTYSVGADLVRLGSNWTLTIPGANALAQGTYNVVATVTDAGGNSVNDASTNELVIDTTPPAQPTVIAQSTNDTTPVITGTATVSTGETLTVTVNNVTYSVGANLVRSGANWTLTIPGANALAQGTYNVVATVTDAAGNLTNDGSTGELVINTTTPAAPTIGLIALDDRVNAIEAGSAVTISGTLPEADRPVTVQWGSTAARAATVVGTNWSTTYASGDIPVDGAQTVRATYVNAYGSTSVEGTRSVLIDRAAPGTPTIALNPLSDSGTLGDSITSDDTPTIRVTLGTGAAADDTITVFSGAATVGTATLSAPDISAGYVDVTTSALGEDGTKSLTATITDLVGNPSSASGALVLTIDRTSPARPAVGTLTTNDTTPVITGTATVGTGETLTVTVNGVTYPVGADLVRSGINWTLSIPSGNALAQGTYSVVATVTDAAGNSASDTSLTELVIDTTLPAAPSLSLAAGSDSGVPGDGITNDDTPTIRVELAGSGATAPVAGDTVTIFSGGGQVGTVALSASNISNDFVNITTSAFELDGSKTLTATITDAAGNVSDESGSLAITIDRAAPTVTIADVLDNTPDPGVSVSVPPPPGTTDDNSPTLVLTFSEVFGAGATVEVFRNAASIGFASASGSTTANFTDSGAPVDGTYQYTAQMTDAAGNLGALSSAYTVIIDTTP